MDRRIFIQRRGFWISKGGARSRQVFTNRAANKAALQLCLFTQAASSKAAAATATAPPAADQHQREQQSRSRSRSRSRSKRSRSRSRRRRSSSSSSKSSTSKPAPAGAAKQETSASRSSKAEAKQGGMTCSELKNSYFGLCDTKWTQHRQHHQPAADAAKQETHRGMIWRDLKTTPGWNPDSGCIRKS